MHPEDLETTPPDLRGITSFAFGGRDSRDSPVNEHAVVARVVRYIAGLDASSPLRALGAGDVVRFRVDLYRDAELAASYGVSDEALDTEEGIQAVLDLLGAAGTVVKGIISEMRPAADRLTEALDLHTDRLLQSVNADDLTPATPMLQSQQLEHEFQRIGLVADESFTALLPFATVAEALSWLQTIPDGAGPSGLAEDLYLRFQARLASIRDRKV